MSVREAKPETLDCRAAREALAEDARGTLCEALRTHLDGCLDCQRFAEEARAIQSLARELGRQAPPVTSASPSRRPVAMVPTLAGVLAVALLFGAALIDGLGFKGHGGGADASPPRFAAVSQDAAVTPRSIPTHASRRRAQHCRPLSRPQKARQTTRTARFFGDEIGSAAQHPARSRVCGEAPRNLATKRTPADTPSDGDLFAALDRARAVWSRGPNDGSWISGVDPLGEVFDIRTSLVDLALAGRLDELIASKPVTITQTKGK